MLSVYKKLQGEGFEYNSTREITKLGLEVDKFYKAKTLECQLFAMATVRYVYEGMQLKANANFRTMDETTTKTVGQFHRLSTTIVAQELEDDSQYLDKIMDKVWDIVCQGKSCEEIKELLDTIRD